MFNNEQDLKNRIRVVLRETLIEHSFGGNSGYVGYSMSRRAAQAREDGRFPKTDFKKNYQMTERTFGALKDLGIIVGNEWHHTSKFGNKTYFYSFLDDIRRDCWNDNSEKITKLAKIGDVDAVDAVFDEYIKNTEEENARRLNLLKKYGEYVKEYQIANDKFDSSVTFHASNGCVVEPDGTVWKDGERLSKRNKAFYRDQAKAEYEKAAKAWRNGLLGFEEFCQQNSKEK